MPEFYDNKAVSDRILREIADKEMSHYKFCKEVGIAATTFSGCINNKSKWQVDTLTKIAIYLNMSLDYLILGNSTNNESVLREEVQALRVEITNLKTASRGIKNALIEILTNENEQSVIGKQEAP